jgi:FkbM family methyltransferase
MNTPTLQSLSEIIDCLPGIASEHAHSTSTYQSLDKLARKLALESGFHDAATNGTSFGEFGQLTFPYTKMGAIDTLDLFGLDELIIFAFYWTNRSRYRRAADIGANLGLHSLLMAKCGWHIKAYEPDPHHASLLRRNVQLNGLAEQVELIEAAVSDKPGTLEFVRVLGNTTSSHLAGAKSGAYGQLEKFPVRVEAIETIMPQVDFVKMDAEGQEKIIILGTTAEHWKKTDMMVEVGSVENATAIFEHLKKVDAHAFAQKLGWAKVTSLADMPTSYKDGSLFITRQQAMPWA